MPQTPLEDDVTHWHKLLENFDTSSRDFYASVEGACEASNPGAQDQALRLEREWGARAEARVPATDRRPDCLRCLRSAVRDRVLLLLVARPSTGDLGAAVGSAVHRSGVVPPRTVVGVDSKLSMRRALQRMSHPLDRIEIFPHHSS